MSRVIFHADDFGLTKGVNNGIIKAHREGVIKSSSIIPSGTAFEHAIRLAHENPTLDLGVHLTLVEEKCLSDPQLIPSLVNSNGVFRKNFKKFIKDFFLGKIMLKEIEIELEAQIKKCLNSGLTISHIDSHQHLHVLPGVLHRVYCLADKYKVPFVRTQIGLDKYFQWSKLAKLKRYNYLYGLQLMSFFSRSLILQKSGRLGSIKCYGFISSGQMCMETITKIFNTQEDLYEIMLHPGIADDDTARLYGHWGYDWDKELELVISPQLKQEMKSRRISSFSFKELCLD
ncbi:MAG: carbohydrate deacetylase [Candidatus Hodarchaeota archaeon]